MWRGDLLVASESDVDDPPHLLLAKVMPEEEEQPIQAETGKESPVAHRPSGTAKSVRLKEKSSG